MLTLLHRAGTVALVWPRFVIHEFDPPPPEFDVEHDYVPIVGVPFVVGTGYALPATATLKVSVHGRTRNATRERLGELLTALDGLQSVGLNGRALMLDGPVSWDDPEEGPFGLRFTVTATLPLLDALWRDGAGTYFTAWGAV